MKEEPNQSLEPTSVLGTSAAEQPLAPGPETGVWLWGLGSRWNAERNPPVRVERLPRFNGD